MRQDWGVGLELAGLLTPEPAGLLCFLIWKAYYEPQIFFKGKMSLNTGGMEAPASE